MNSQLHIAITGASGFIGSEMLRYFAEKNFRITAYVRVIPDHSTKNVIYVKYDLKDGCIGGLPHDIDQFIHLAYVDYNDNNKSDSINLKFCKWLSDTSAQMNFKVTYFSSFSAHVDAISHYGKSKMACEEVFDIQKAIVIKPAFVIGNGGLFKRIKDEILNSKFVFLPDGGKQPVQTIDVLDLCKIVESAIFNQTTGIYLVAHPEVLTLKLLEQKIAQFENVNPKFISISTRLILFFLKATSFVGIKLSVSVENVLGLMAMKSFDTNESMKKLGVEPMSFDDSLKRHKSI